MTEKQLLNESMIHNVVLYMILRRLTKPFKRWDAYKNGIIDENGNVLIKRKNLKTAKDRNSFTLLDVFCLNMKKILGKLPFGKTRLASFAASLYLIKEDKALLMKEDVEKMRKNYINVYEELLSDKTITDTIARALRDYKFEEDMVEDAPANVTSGIAGVKSGDDPVIRQKPKPVRRKDFGYL